RIENAEQGAIDGGRAEVRAAGSRYATGGVTGPAGNAVALALGLPAELGVGPDDGQLHGPRPGRVQSRANPFPLFEERLKRNDQVLEDRQMTQRPDGYGTGLQRFDAGLAGQARHPVDRHGAGAAHADAAGTAEGKAWVVLAMDDEKGVQHRHPALGSDP